MSDASYQERTEAATPRKREEARTKGKVARSQELTTAFLLLGSALVVRQGLPKLARGLADIFARSARGAAAPPVGLRDTVAWLEGIGWDVVGALATPVAGIAGVTVLVGLVQARGVFSAEAIQPQWSRISPHQNLKRLMGFRSVAELAKALTKLGIVGLAVYSSVAAAWAEAVTLPLRSPQAFVELIHRYTVRLLFTAGLAYLALALADYLYQLWTFEKELRMTKEEVKREHKETEGDPMIKARLRSMGRALARRRMMADVPKADVVVTNPTHIAVALKYDPQVAAAPVVVAMGQRKIAARIKQVALVAGVDVVENKPLARALLATGRVGLPIPAELYVAVAEVLAFVLRRRSARAGAWAGEAVL